MHIFSVRVPAHHGGNRRALACGGHFCNVCLQGMRQCVYQSVAVSVTCGEYNLSLVVKPADKKVQPHLAGRKEL